jgi:hypothetical protein
MGKSNIIKLKFCLKFLAIERKKSQTKIEVETNEEHTVLFTQLIQIHLLNVFSHGKKY